MTAKPGKMSTTSRMRLLHPLLLLAALLVLPADSVSGPRERPSAGPAAPEVTHHLYHMFDPSDTNQLRRAAAWQEANRQPGGVHWIGVHRTDSGPASQMASAVHQLEDLLHAGQLPAAVHAWLVDASAVPEAGDQVLLWSLSHDTVWAGPAAEAVSVMGGLGRSLPTDVGVTTWGKVKELFR